MSFEAVVWALNEGQRLSLEPTQRHVLLVLANRADEQGYLYPSIGWVEQRTGLSRRTVQMTVKGLQERQILRRSARSNEHGGRTSDEWWLAMAQPGLGLDTPRADSAPPRAANSRGGAQQLREGGARAAPKTKDKKKEEGKPSEGGHAASPTSQAFALYSDGMQAKYGAPYPPSAKANGQLAQVVKRIGAEATMAVIPWVLASPDPYYAKTKHRLESLVRDCEQLWMSLQVRSGGPAAKPPTEARCYMAWSTKDTRAELDPQPLGEPLDIAQRVARIYSRGITIRKADYIDVQIGQANHRYSIAELNQPQGARP